MECFVQLYLAVLSLVSTTTGELINVDKFVEEINSAQNTWVAARSATAQTRLSVMHGFEGVVRSSLRLDIMEHDDEFIRSLPESFHAKEKWPNCTSLDEIRDQGACGSCWAFGAAEAMTDRYCTYSNGSNTQVHISAQELVTCCPDCYSHDGCHGGSPAGAWQHWKNKGLVTGGNYNSKEGCKPYTFQKCTHHHADGTLPPCGDYITAPACTTKCEDGYDKTYDQDKAYGDKVYYVEGEQQIMAEIYKNGPVEVAFECYTDFVFYKRGVYKQTNGTYKADHAVKALGWGVENGVKYWLIANSWNEEWGDRGFVKFLRGENHLGIEGAAWAGEPKLTM